MTTILLVVVGEEHDILAHSLHIRVALHNFVVLQVGVQDRSGKEVLTTAFTSLGEVHTGCGERLLDACDVGH